MILSPLSSDQVNDDEESQKRIDMHVDPKENKELMDLDIIELVSSSSADTVPALMARLES